MNYSACRDQIQRYGFIWQEGNLVKRSKEVFNQRNPQAHDSNKIIITVL
uniref:Uncharacterized protein n=1 Tax=Anguilla anguilla TaxID=7936 RepID=A0A0E9QCC8_ANGAN